MAMTASTCGVEAADTRIASAWHSPHDQGADLLLNRGACSERADHWMRCLRTELNWQQEMLFLFGRQVTVPRLVAWYGDAGAEYRYSGKLHRPQPWSPTLAMIRKWLEHLTQARFNSVLANLYRDGQDAMGWHSDDEAELGTEPVIASVSLGAERTMRFRTRARPRSTFGLSLPHGSVLLMRGQTQSLWQHCIPRSRRVKEARINLTFRLIRTVSKEK